MELELQSCCHCGSTEPHPRAASSVQECRTGWVDGRVVSVAIIVETGEGGNTWQQGCTTKGIFMIFAWAFEDS